jgi:ABC-type methionine transport system ATPase subunit
MARDEARLNSIQPNRSMVELAQRTLNISFDLKRGEIVGVIGRSGAGKSTLIRCLNGLERPDSGRIEVLGEDIAPLGERDLRRLRLRVGMIFQHFNLLSSKTVISCGPRQPARISRCR